jgi:cell division septal protein FtsQ
MILRIRWPFMVMGLMLLLMTGACAYAYFSDIFILRNVRITPDKYADALAEMNILLGKNIFLAPIDDALSYLLYSHPAAKADLHYRLPNTVTIDVTDFVPIALTLGPDRTTMYGLDDNGRLLPVEKPEQRFELPLITGVKTGSMYQRIRDDKLQIIMNQLGRLRTDENDFYHAVSLIDLPSGDSIIVYSDGLPFYMVMYPDGLYNNIVKLKQFLLGFNPDLKETIKLDFRSNGQIIALKKEVKEDTKKNVRVKNNNGH